MAIIAAETINNSSKIKIEIPDLANYIISATFIDPDSSNELFHLNDEGFVLLPPNRDEFLVFCTAKPQNDNAPPPTARVWVSQDDELLQLFNRSNPTTISAYETKLDDTYRMNFTLFWPFNSQ